jgi:apolipoprotein N-acyltransferase
MLHPWILSVLGGFLYALSFPPFDFALPAWLALIPLIVAARTARSGLQAFLGGALAALVMCGFGFAWIADMAHRFWLVPWPVAALLLLAYATFGEINFSFFVFLAWRLRSRLERWPAAATAALFAIVERVVPKVFPDALAHTQINVPGLPAAAALVGTTGLSFLVAWFAACLAWYPAQQSVSRRRRLAELGLCLLAIAGMTAYGAQRLRHVDALEPARQLEIVIVQTNIGDPEILLRQYSNVSTVYDTIVARYVDMTRRALKDADADLVLWPETAIPGAPRGVSFEPARRLIQTFGTPLVLGGFDYQQAGPRDWRIYNTMFLLGPRGMIRDRYYKHKLLPLGEYVPFSDHFPVLMEWIPDAGDFSPGPGAQVIELDGLRFAPFICYEILFPRYVRRGVRQGADVLLNITNDFWFGRYAEPEQHLKLARMRAFETARPIIRATNTGFSALIGANGRVLRRTALWQPEVLRATLDVPPPQQTPYLRAGEWLTATFLLLTLGLTALIWKRVP